MFLLLTSVTHSNQSLLYVSYSWNFRHRLVRYYWYAGDNCQVVKQSNLKNNMSEVNMSKDWSEQNRKRQKVETTLWLLDLLVERDFVLRGIILEFGWKRDADFGPVRFLVGGCWWFSGGKIALQFFGCTTEKQNKHIGHDMLFWWKQ